MDGWVTEIVRYFWAGLFYAVDMDLSLLIECFKMGAVTLPLQVSTAETRNKHTHTHTHFLCER